jgi:RNA polymerase sigma factor (sigma-70 family)
MQGMSRPERTEMGIPPFQTFLDEYRDTVYRFLVASVGPNDADDCFQETFLAALRAYPRLRHGSNLKAWVLTIATHKVIDAGRASSRRPASVADVETVADPPETSEAAVTAAGDPLWGAVRGLPPRQRTALVHRYVLDQSYADVAEAMGTSEETARQNVHMGLKRLRKEVVDDERA